MVCPARSTFRFEEGPRVACPVGNTCTNPGPSEPVIVTFMTTAVAVASTRPRQARRRSMTEPRSNYPAGTPVPSLVSITLVGATDTRRDVFSSAAQAAVADSGSSASGARQPRAANLRFPPANGGVRGAIAEWAGPPNRHYASSLTDHPS